MIQTHRHSIEAILIQISLVVISIEEMFKEHVLQTKQIVTSISHRDAIDINSKLSCVF